jgi:hypothetical protein
MIMHKRPRSLNIGWFSILQKNENNFYGTWIKQKLFAVTILRPIKPIESMTYFLAWIFVPFIRICTSVITHLLSLYLSVKRSHHVRREGLEIPTLIQKRDEYTPLDFMKIWRSRLIQRIHEFRIKIRKSKESIFNTNTINKYINSELKLRKNSS